MFVGSISRTLEVSPPILLGSQEYLEESFRQHSHRDTPDCVVRLFDVRVLRQDCYFTHNLIAESTDSEPELHKKTRPSGNGETERIRSAA